MSLLLNKALLLMGGEKIRDPKGDAKGRKQTSLAC